MTSREPLLNDKLTEPHAELRCSILYQCQPEFSRSVKNVDNYQLRPRIGRHGYGEFDDVHPSATILAAGVSKNDEFCIKNEELCITNEELCITNEDFALKVMNFAGRRPEDVSTHRSPCHSSISREVSDGLLGVAGLDSRPHTPPRCAPRLS